MEFKGTKGEWVIDKYNSISCNGKTVLVGSGIGFTMHEDAEPKANAKLIASAPDLLEALTMLIEETEDYVNETACGNTYLDIAREKARKAIEKALK